MDLIAESLLESNTVDFADDRIILSSDELSNNLLEFNMIWGLLYDVGDIGVFLMR